MLRGVSPTELLIVLAIVLLLFGVGRVSRIGKELGSAVSEFRKGITEGKNDESTEPEEQAKP